MNAQAGADGVENILARRDLTIKQALKKMDRAGEKTLLVVDAGRRLLGTVTDGDIRRWILSSGRMTAPVGKVMNRRPLFLEQGFSSANARELMTRHKVECLPVLNAGGAVVSAIWWIDFFKKRSNGHRNLGLPVVIMAGGEGKRLGLLTRVLPKPLMPIGDKTIIQRIMERFHEQGCSKFFLSVNYKSKLIKAFFGDLDHGFTLRYLDEKTPLGTAGSLRMLRGRIRSTFFLSNCDILIDANYSDILEFHRKSSNAITLVASMKHYTIPYGVCRIKKGGQLQGLQEKPEFDFLVNTGLYILEPEVLDCIPANIVFHFTDLIEEAAKSGRRVGVYPVSERSWTDTGQLEELQEALKQFEAPLS